MATVDLDKLSAELTAAGIPFLDHSHRGGNRRFECFGWVIWTGDEPASWFQNIPPNPNIWTALDIIRRHVAPVAPDPGLREAIAKAIYNADVSSCDCDCSDCIHQAAVDADAVLAVLAERGVR